MSRLACTFIAVTVVMLTSSVAVLCCESYLARGARGYLPNGAGEDVWQLLQSAYPEERIQAAGVLSATLQRPTIDEVRKLSGVMRADVDPRVRCAIAGVFGAVASRRHYRVVTHRTAPEVAAMLQALREGLIYELTLLVKICIVNAAGEFNSSEAVVIIDRAKGDINQEVREAARVSERKREQRLRETGQ
ncbi:MAG: hypothetical protein HY711_08915 [Candidatus Melainabacteria bacterium]|nr:hypothetical protein [Candidatus Melainabacteria bacterium]